MGYKELGLDWCKLSPINFQVCSCCIDAQIEILAKRNRIGVLVGNCDTGMELHEKPLKKFGITAYFSLVKGWLFTNDTRRWLYKELQSYRNNLLPSI